MNDMDRAIQYFQTFDKILRIRAKDHVLNIENFLRKNDYTSLTLFNIVLH